MRTGRPRLRTGLATRMGRQRFAGWTRAEFLATPAVIGGRFLGKIGVASRTSPLEVSSRVLCLLLVPLCLLVAVPVLNALLVDGGPAQRAGPDLRGTQNLVCANGAFVVVVANILVNSGAKVISC
jgi:hypothetical protein